MVIHTKISLKEYTKLLFTLAYKKLIMIVIVSVAVLNGCWILCYNLDLLNVPEPKTFQYFGLLLILVVQPLGIFFMIWRNYETSCHFKETLELHITKEGIKMLSVGFKLEISWKNINKTVELKNWFVIYQNNLSAIIIPKKDFMMNDMNVFKYILLSNKESPVSLRK